MRDRELMLSLLREMAGDEDGPGRLFVPLSDHPETQQRHHHVELLVDLGHAQWTDRDTARITYAGYDFLENRDKAKNSFVSHAVGS